MNYSLHITINYNYYTVSGSYFKFNFELCVETENDNGTCRNMF